MAGINMEAVAANLQQRIGQLVSQYETDVAIIKSQAADQLAESENRLAESQKEVERLNGLVQEYEANKPATKKTTKPATPTE